MNKLVALSLWALAGQAFLGCGGGGMSNYVCPEEQPLDGETCGQEGVICEYGDDVRGEACRTQATCASSLWQVVTPTASTCPQLQDTGACPLIMSQVCNLNTTCTKDDGNVCRCTNCPPTAPICVETPAWYCPAPVTTAGCPRTPPNLGTTCSTKGSECGYFQECGQPDKVCSHGIWTPGQVLGCPS